VPHAVTAFLVVAPVSAALAAAGGSFALATAGVIAPAEARAILLPWFVGDFVGVVALGPALAALLERLAATFRLRSTPLFGAVSRLRPARPGWRRFVFLFALCLLPLAGSLAFSAASACESSPPRSSSSSRSSRSCGSSTPKGRPARSAPSPR
jgi:hypothetical protein